MCEPREKRASGAAEAKAPRNVAEQEVTFLEVLWAVLVPRSTFPSEPSRGESQLDRAIHVGNLASIVSYIEMRFGIFYI